MNLYGLIIGFSLVVLINSFEKKNQNLHLIPNGKVSLFISLLLLFTLVGARAYHVFDYWTYYSHHIPEIINLKAGGLGIFGAILGGSIFILIYSLISKSSALQIFDLFTPTLPLTQSIARWGNYFNQEIYSPTGRPLWLYESISCFILYLVIRKTKSKPTSIYLIGYGLIRLILDAQRTDTWTINGLKISQLLSVIFIILGLVLILWKRPKTQSVPSSGSSA